MDDHELPALRLSRTWTAAEQIGERSGISRAVALEIAREVVNIIGAGTRRWGNLCPDCRSLLEVQGDRRVCPQHGSLGWLDSSVLLIAFDPIGANDG